MAIDIAEIKTRIKEEGSDYSDFSFGWKTIEEGWRPFESSDELLVAMTRILRGSLSDTLHAGALMRIAATLINELAAKTSNEIVEAIRAARQDQTNRIREELLQLAKDWEVFAVHAKTTQEKEALTDCAQRLREELDLLAFTRKQWPASAKTTQST